MQQVHISRHMTRIALFIAIAGSWLLVAASTTHAGAGETGLAFLKLGASARGVAMGDAMAGAVYGAAATFYNPAGLGIASKADAKSELLFMHKEWIQDTRTEFLGSRFSMGDRHALGVSVLTTTVADIEIRTRPGEAQGTFTSRDLGIGLTYCYEIDHGLRAGLTARYLYEQLLVDDAQGIGIDVGAQYDGLVDGLTVGAALANIGSMSEFRNEPVKLPALIRAGAAYRMDFLDLYGVAILAADVEDVLAESTPHARIGGECAFKDVFFIRGGYQFGSEGRGLSAGGGVQYGIFGVDYGFSRLSGALGNGHTISIRAEF
jgi:hypothetical protein